MSRTYGLEKFSHLEDKIYRTIDQVKRERRERESLEHELERIRAELATAIGDKQHLEKQIQRLMSERDSIKLKIESMLQTVRVLDLEAGSAGK
jgi:chromosome segregation ATPase